MNKKKFHLFVWCLARSVVGIKISHCGSTLRFKVVVKITGIVTRYWNRMYRIPKATRYFPAKRRNTIYFPPNANQSGQSVKSRGVQNCYIRATGPSLFAIQDSGNTRVHTSAPDCCHLICNRQSNRPRIRRELATLVRWHNRTHRIPVRYAGTSSPSQIRTNDPVLN